MRRETGSIWGTGLPPSAYDRYAQSMIEYSYRVATQDDIQAITDIYNAAVIRGGSSADITPRTYEQRKAWVESHHDPYAVFVTETADDDGKKQIIDSARFPFSTIAQDTTASPISPIISIRNGRAGESVHTHSPNCLKNVESVICVRHAALFSQTMPVRSH